MWPRYAIPGLDLGSPGPQATVGLKFSSIDTAVVISLRFGHQCLCIFHWRVGSPPHPLLLLRLPTWTEVATERSCHSQCPSHGVPLPHHATCRMREGRGGDLVTHQNRVKRREEAVQALGGNIRLLVSVTEPLHCRNAARARDRVRKGSHTRGPPLPLRDQCHTPQPPSETLLPTTLSAHAGSPRVIILQHWTKQCLQKVSMKGFLAASPRKLILNLLSKTHRKFGSASLSRSRLFLPPMPSYRSSIQQKYVSGFRKAIHSPPKSFPSTAPARGLHNPQI